MAESKSDHFSSKIKAHSEKFTKFASLSVNRLAPDSESCMRSGGHCSLHSPLPVPGFLRVESRVPCAAVAASVRPPFAEAMLLAVPDEIPRLILVPEQARFIALGRSTFFGLCHGATVRCGPTGQRAKTRARALCFERVCLGQSERARIRFWG
jgi:hypothetical protein